MVVLLGLETAALAAVAYRLPAVRATARDTIRSVSSYYYGEAQPEDASLKATRQPKQLRLRPSLLPKLRARPDGGASSSVLALGSILEQMASGF